MIYFLALLPATALTIGGYVALYISARSEGGLKTFGKYLGFWAFTLAALVILGAIFAAAHHHRHGVMGMHCHMPPPWAHDRRAFGPHMERHEGEQGGEAPAGAPAENAAAPGSAAPQNPAPNAH